LTIFLKPVEKIQVSLKLDKKNGHYRFRPTTSGIRSSEGFIGTLSYKHEQYGWNE